MTFYKMKIKYYDIICHKLKYINRQLQIKVTASISKEKGG